MRGMEWLMRRIRRRDGDTEVWVALFVAQADQIAQTVGDTMNLSLAERQEVRDDYLRRLAGMFGRP